MNTPIVSILINNHNYGRFLADAIASALGQSYPHTEVIVVDDGSTDHSRHILRQFDGRITAHFQPNLGQGAAINRAFALSRGSIILLLDADDTFLPEKASEVVRVFQNHPAIGWCFHPVTLLHTATSSTTPPPPNLPSGFIDFRRPISQAILPTFAPATSALCFARSLLDQLLPMPELDGTSADRYLKLAALILAPGFFLKKPLTIQKIHGQNAFTLQSHKKQVEARSLLHTATWLRSRFPSHTPLANKLFAMGLGIYWRLGTVDPRHIPITRDYLATTPPLSRLAALLRAYYHASPLFAALRRHRTHHIQNP